jgi:hypothetical protein
MINKIINYFYVLWLEILKAIMPPKKKNITVKEIMEELKHKNKNELIDVLAKTVGNYERSIPMIPNKKEIKKFSKRVLIKSIINVILRQHYESEESKGLKEVKI